MDDLTTDCSFDSQAMWVIDVLGLFFDVINGCLYDKALAVVRSTGAGIKYLYCNLGIQGVRDKVKIMVMQ